MNIFSKFRADFNSVALICLSILFFFPHILKAQEKEPVREKRNLISLSSGVNQLHYIGGLEGIAEIRENKFAGLRVGTGYFRESINTLTSSEKNNVWAFSASVFYLFSNRKLKNHIEAGINHYSYQSYTAIHSNYPINFKVNYLNGYLGYRYQNLNKSSFCFRIGLNFAFLLDVRYQDTVQGVGGISKTGLLRKDSKTPNAFFGAYPEVTLGWTLWRRK